MRSDRERLLDILEAIDRIDAHKGEGRLVFDTDELLQIWFVHHLQIIGEAASRVSDEIRTQHPEVPWGQLIGMRHILVHGYFDVDLEIVWNAAQVNLIQLKEQLEDILRNIKNSEQVIAERLYCLNFPKIPQMLQLSYAATNLVGSTFPQAIFPRI